MKRAIVTAPALAPSALAELKDWLGITTAAEDAALGVLLMAALESCEAFTGSMPIECVCEEVHPLSGDWTILETRPVQAITGIEAILTGGTRTALATSAYAIDFSADGAGRVRILDPGLAERITVRFSAGLAGDWASLPDGLRHGLMRLAAHLYRQREGEDTAALPPASVAALWRPWRRLRLA